MKPIHTIWKPPLGTEDWDPAEGMTVRYAEPEELERLRAERDRDVALRGTTPKKKKKFWHNSDRAKMPGAK